MREKKRAISCAAAAWLSLYSALSAAHAILEEKPATPAPETTQSREKTPSASPEKTSPAADTRLQDEMQARMQADMQAAAAGPAHQEMARRAGEYTTASKFRMEPGAPPIESSGTAKIESVLGGRFLMEEYSATLNRQPYRGMRLFGYNNITKQYETSWVYSLSSAILTMTGTSNDGGKTVDYKGRYDDPVGGTQKLRAVIRKTDKDRFVVTIYGVSSEGKEMATLETVYTRKK